MPPLGIISYRLPLELKRQVNIRSLTTSSKALSVNNGRWLSDTKTRLGKLFFHGTTTEETKEASEILKDLTKNWRDYVAASEGFLTGETRRGLYRHNVVWGDMDSMSWSELWTPKGLGLILRSIKVDYKFPVEWPDKITVYHKLEDFFEDSFTLNVIILSEKHQRLAARCHEDIVIYNYQPTDKTQRPGKTKIPKFMRTQFDEALRLQKEARGDALDSMRDITERVDGLEKRVLGREEMV